MSKERPMLFSGPMVRAILRETDPKTQTRRVVKPQPEVVSFGFRWKGREIGERIFPVMCNPYGAPGDRIWVRESWNVSGLAFIRKPRETSFAAPSAWKYAATDDGSWKQGWRPSIHMPRWASRILLEIVSVRVERLQDISEADAIAEGASQKIWITSPFSAGCNNATSERGSFRDGYKDLWESINGPGSWDANPWVWVVTFRRVTP